MVGDGDVGEAHAERHLAFEATDGHREAGRAGPRGDEAGEGALAAFGVDPAPEAGGGERQQQGEPGGGDGELCRPAWECRCPAHGIGLKRSRSKCLPQTDVDLNRIVVAALGHRRADVEAQRSEGGIISQSEAAADQ